MDSMDSKCGYLATPMGVLSWAETVYYWCSPSSVFWRLVVVFLWMETLVGPVKADSHITCRAHAVPLRCHAAKSLECGFPIRFTQCRRVWFTLAMPCPCYAPTMPFFSKPRHSTSVERRPVGFLSRSASSGYHTEFHEVYPTHINLRRRWLMWN